MEHEWFKPDRKPKDCAAILVIIQRFDGKLLIEPARFFEHLFQGDVVYLHNSNSDKGLDFNKDIIGWCYYPELPNWAYLEAARKRYDLD